MAKPANLPATPVPLYDPILPVRYATPLLEFVREQEPGLVARILGDAGVSAGRDAGWDAGPAPGLAGLVEGGADAVLTMPQFDRLMAAAGAALGRSDLGFELGLRLGVHSHASLSVALASCPTLHEMLQLLSRFWNIVTTCFSVEYRRGPSEAEWCYRPMAGMSAGTLRAMQELLAVALHGDIARLFGSGLEVDIHLSMDAPAHVARYRSLHGTRFHFGARPLPEVRCVLPAGVLDLPLAGRVAGQAAGRSSRRPGAVALREKDLATGKARRCGEWVELILREAEGVQPSRETLAGLLGVRPRTLTRMLAAEGIDLRALGRRVRHERACAMLAGGRMPVTQVAHRLGYSDAANFTNAFRRDGGSTPSGYRARMAGGQAAGPGTTREPG